MERAISRGTKRDFSVNCHGSEVQSRVLHSLLAAGKSPVFPTDSVGLARFVPRDAPRSLPPLVDGCRWLAGGWIRPSPRMRGNSFLG
jgi:hypothetical protein